MSGVSNLLGQLTAVPLPAAMGGTGNAAAAAELARLGAVGYGAAQILTAAQIRQARANIGIELARADIASAVSSVIFTLPSGYSAFRLLLDGVQTSVNNDSLGLQMSSDGSTWLGGSGSTVYTYEVEVLQGGAAPAVYTGTAGTMILTSAVTNTTSGIGLSGDALIWPGSSSRAARMMSRCSSFQTGNGSTPQRYMNDTWYNATAVAMAAIRIAGGTGSINAGSLRLIGEAT